MQETKDIPQGIILAAVGMLLPYIPNITADSLQKALEAITHQATTSEKDARPQKPLTRKEAAEMLGVSIPTVDRYINKGCLTPVRYSARAVRISAESVYSLMKGGMA